MTIQQIKATVAKEQGIELNTLMIQQQTGVADEAGNKPKEPWFYHWENKARIKVSMHEDVYNKIKEDKERNDLVLKDAVAVAARGETAAYIRYIVMIPDSVVATF